MIEEALRGHSSSCSPILWSLFADRIHLQDPNQIMLLDVRGRCVSKLFALALFAAV